MGRTNGVGLGGIVNGMDHSVFLTGRRLRRFEILQAVLVPRSQTLSPGQRAKGFRLVDDLLAEKTILDHIRLNVFMILILWSCYLLEGRSLLRASEIGKQRHLTRFLDAQLPLLRKGFWGLNTLAKLSVYGQIELYDELGYALRGLHENP